MTMVYVLYFSNIPNKTDVIVFQNLNDAIAEMERYSHLFLPRDKGYGISYNVGPNRIMARCWWVDMTGEKPTMNIEIKEQPLN